MPRGVKRPLDVRLEEHASLIRRKSGMPAATWDVIMRRMAEIVSNGEDSDAMQAADLMLKFQRLSMEAAQMEMAANRAAAARIEAPPGGVPAIIDASPDDEKKNQLR